MPTKMYNVYSHVVVEYYCMIKTIYNTHLNQSHWIYTRTQILCCSLIVSRICSETHERRVWIEEIITPLYYNKNVWNSKMLITSRRNNLSFHYLFSLLVVLLSIYIYVLHIHSVEEGKFLYILVLFSQQFVLKRHRKLGTRAFCK